MCWCVGGSLHNLFVVSGAPGVGGGEGAHARKQNRMRRKGDKQLTRKS